MRKVILLILSIIITSSCAEKSDPKLQQANIEITDFLERKIIFDKPVQRAISTAPNITEIIYALNAEDKLVAVSNWCDYPLQAKQKPNIGDFANPSLERIIALKSDVIFASTQKRTPTLDKFEQMGLTVVCLHPKNFDELLRSIQLIGKIFDKQIKADSLITQMKSGLSQLQQFDDSLRVYVEIYANPLMTVSNNSLLGEMITLAGGKNIAFDLSQPYPTISAEKIIVTDPQVIITAYPNVTKEEIANRLGWQNVSAIKNGNIFTNINQDILLRPSPRVIEGIKALNQAFAESQAR